MSEPAHGPSYAELEARLKMAQDRLLIERSQTYSLLKDIREHWQASDILRLRIKRLLSDQS